MTALEEYRKAQHVWENISLLDRDTAIDEARTVNRAAMDAIAELEAELAALKATLEDCHRQVEHAEAEVKSERLLTAVWRVHIERQNGELAALKASLAVATACAECNTSGSCSAPFPAEEAWTCPGAAPEEA